MEKEPKNVAQNATPENEVVANAKTPPALFGAANGGDSTGETEGLSELALAGGETNGLEAATGTPPAEGVREADELGRVQLTSSKDNAFHASRWENTDGTTTKYADTFKEKIKIELKREFGKDITHAEVLKMIADAKKANDLVKAEDYRKKLFRANQYAVVEALNVDKTTTDGKVSGQNALGQDFSTTQNHEMYGRISGSTYCNIYAYDVVTAMGAYVPRCWWTDKYEKEAIAAMEKKEAYATVPKYGTNVSEMNANALNAWFDRVGKYFGWRKATSMEEGQNAANNGNVVVLQAANKVASKSGHIAVILSERDDHAASRDKDKKVDVPLTSQAGSVNHKYKTGGKWWEDANHKNGAAWIHDGAMDSPLLTPEEIGVQGAPAAAATTTAPAPTSGGEKPVTPPVKPAAEPVKAPATKDNKPATQTATNPKGSLVLKKFELTVQGEGADGATKYIEWPNTSASGVTLGKGYDIGSRSAKQVIDDLTASGMSKAQAEKISKGVGLKGQAAGDWVKANKKDVGEIALDVQYKLLDIVMPKFTAQAENVATNTKAEKDSGGNYTNAAGREKGDGVKAGTYVMSKEQWTGLHPAMVEFITDLKYQGGYYLYDRIEKINAVWIKNHGNHLEQFKAVAALFEGAKAGELSYMDNYGKGIGEGTGNKELFYGMTKDQLANASTRRNRIRLAFLKHIIAAMEAGKTVTYDAIEKVEPGPQTKPVTVPAAQTTTSNGSATNAQPVAETPVKEAAVGGEAAAKDDKNVTISRGVLQMTSEGSFNGDSTDVRTPHFPENLAIYTPIAAGEQIEAKNRFEVTGDRAKKSASGAYKRKTLLNRHEVADYDTKATGSDKIATGPNNSGVTIGFGYDIGAAWGTGDKEKCKKDLKAAGISEENAEALSAAVGLRTMAAGKKTAELRKTVKITADQAVNLLGVVMGRYDANYTKGVVHPALEEAFSYVNYWKGNGGGKAFVSKMFEAAKDKKGAEQFTAVIGVIDAEGWGGGFDVIKNYLKVIKAKLDDGNTVSVVNSTSLDGLTNGDNDTFDIVKESAKGTHIGKKDLHEQLTGKPKAAATTSGTTAGKETTPVKPAVKPADAPASIIKDTVGSGGKNNPADVRVVKQCLYNAGLDVTVNDVADQKLTDAIIAFQKAHFSWTPDGLVSPGKNTVKKLAEFKNVQRPAAQQSVKPATAVAQETPAQRMEKEHKKYSDGQIDMVGLAKAMKVYAVSSPATVLALIGKLSWNETDNFAYAFAAHSSDAELGTFDKAMLRRLSDELDTYMTMSRTANLGQKARIDKAISKPVVVPAAKPVSSGGEKPATAVVKPVAKPVASEKETPAANTATGSTRAAVTISKSVGVDGKNDADDLKKIQDLLKDIGFRLGSSKLQKNTNGAIAAFQVANGLGSDGRVDPGGKTLETMNNTPTGAFKTTAKQLAEDENAPRLTHSKWTNRAHFATDTAGEIIPRQFYGNMTTLIKYMEIIADNLTGSFNVNCGYRSPHHNANTANSAERSNHMYGRAVDIDPTDYTPTQFAAELRKLIKAGKIHAGGIGTYGSFVHYDIDASREWNG